MSQPTSIQMLDAAIWQELGGEKANNAEAVYTRHAPFPVAARPFGLSRNGGNQAFCEGPGICRPTGTFLVTMPLKESLCTRF
jgi:hypothetical protein